MRAAEKNLLLAVRNRLREVGQFESVQCEIEYDEMAPATTGLLYIAVLSAGWMPGPHHRKAGGLNDLVYAIDVAAVIRAANVPRDRQRNVFFQNLTSIANVADKIYEVIDFKYETMNLANELILEETGSTEGFIEPLKFQGIEKRPRMAPAEMFAGVKGDGKAGLVRVIQFGGARRMTHK